MTNYSVARVKNQTLTANTIDRVTFTSNPAECEVKSFGAGRIYFRGDGTDPATPWDDCSSVGAGEALRIPLGTDDTIRLVSSTADAYSVTGL